MTIPAPIAPEPTGGANSAALAVAGKAHAREASEKPGPGKILATDKTRARQKAWREANVDRQRANIRRWKAANRDKVRAGRRRNKLDGRNATIDLLFPKQRGRCAYCRDRVKREAIHLDHIVPRARGGTNRRRNLQICCPDCNLAKNARDPVEFAQSLGRLI